jgi:transposase-like protein
LFLAVQPNKRIFYMAPEQWFGKEVLQAYPDSEADLNAAARCIALDEWTACVFHLMRGVEAALRKWSDQLGLLLKMPVVDANWQDILSEADKALKTLEQQPKSPQRNEDLEYFGDTAAQFRAIKNAWRNHVAHSKRSYDERDAVEIMQHVATFMRKLARRM